MKLTLASPGPRIRRDLWSAEGDLLQVRGLDRVMYERTVLDNGLRIVSSSMPHTRSVSISIFVGAGSRYEPDEIAGVSHFLEHMLFKGTHRRPTPRQIAEAIEGIGGVMNAATDKDLTVYWAKVGDQHFQRAFDVVADSLLDSLLDPQEVEKERAVIIEELSATEDSPADLVGVVIDEVMWPHQPLGRDVGGTRKTVSSISRQDIVNYLQRQYVPENTVVAVAGNISHQQVVEVVAQRMGGWSRAPYGQWYPAIKPSGGPRVAIRTKKTEQAHLCLGVYGLADRDPDRYAQDLLNTIMGEGMSSRLFLEVREKRSLAYDVHSYVRHFQDTGVTAVAAGVDPAKIDQAIGAILGELERVKRGVPEEELVKAKEFVKGRMMLRMEDTAHVSSWLGAQELLRGEILTLDQVLEAVDRVEPADIVRVAERLLVREEMNLAIVGPYRREERFLRLLAEA